MTVKRTPTIWVALLPVFFLIVLLTYNVTSVFKDDALGGSNQVILILSGALTALLGAWQGVKIDDIFDGIAQNIKDTTKPIIILLLIGALAGTWLISGVVPAMIYYGLKLLDPSFFLPASLVICALVSLATGSSWSTTATVGIALIGIGKAMGMNEGLVAGAIISGAYFGDKMSPLSDTTNLAPAMAGTDLFTHIRYMALTTVPSILIALLIFSGIGLFQTNTGELRQVDGVLAEIDSFFVISPALFLVPGLVIALIIRKVDPLAALLAGTLVAALVAVLFQPDMVRLIAGVDTDYLLASYKASFQAMAMDVSIPTDHPMLGDLLSSGGMAGMLNTVWLILSAMIFGGAMEATGFLRVITLSLVRLARSTFSLFLTTGVTCGLVNITASDQYLALVVPGRMFKDVYRERGLAPENLSRTLEDTGTVTSVLVPWNTCGAYQSGVLGVATMTYLPYAFFNILSPLMTLVFAAFKIRIKKLAE
ncbi:MAG: Na+/H+ antiporter NhaC [Bacteroidota bacterium]|nr:Na+/H+ antiporter NhaC [Bacteroidota bacterium]MDX5447066.1 Na+/H+ antiporter NhaC [Bacteroidota bacterium]